MEEECEYGLPSGTCFTARRLEVVAIAGLLWIYFVVCFSSVLWDFMGGFSFSLLRTDTVYCKYEAALPHVPPLLVMRPFFAFRAKKPIRNEAVFSL